MSNVTPLRPRQRVIDASRAAARDGTTLRYEPRQGVRELKCSTCHEIIRYGMCRCTPPAA